MESFTETLTTTSLSFQVVTGSKAYKLRFTCQLCERNVLVRRLAGSCRLQTNRHESYVWVSTQADLPDLRNRIALIETTTTLQTLINICEELGYRTGVCRMTNEYN